VVLLLPKGGQRDAARALLAKGITGKLTMLDGKTGKLPSGTTWQRLSSLPS
jgi:hypothetical protein